MNNFILFVCLHLVVQTFGKPNYSGFHGIDEYIINGEDVDKGKWLWMLSLQVLDPEFRHTCGAALLDERHALTAAHCLDGRYPDMDFRVLAGASYLGEDGVPSDEEDSLNVTGAVLHEDYVRCPACDGGWPNDIALMYLDHDVQMNDFVQPGVLGNSSIDYVGRECYSIGWGKLTGSDEGIPVKLQEIQIDVVSTEECRSLMPIDGSERIQPETHVCIYDYNNVTVDEKKGICSGDSGSPLQCLTDDGQWHIIGDASWVVIGPEIESACNPNYPGVYADAISYLDWIQEKIDDPSWKPEE